VIKFKSETDKKQFLIETDGQMCDATLKNKRRSFIKAIDADITNGFNVLRESMSGKKLRHYKPLANFITGMDINNFYERLDITKALTSIKTHLIIEMGYYHTVYDQLGLDKLFEDYSSLYRRLADKIANGKEVSISESDQYILINLVEAANIIKSFADKSGKSIKEVEKIWDDTANELKKQGRKEDDDSFYPVLVTILKKKLKIG
jgi:hypothetical protein